MQSSVPAVSIQCTNAPSERTLSSGARERNHLIRDLACAGKQSALPGSRIPPGAPLFRLGDVVAGRPIWCQREGNVLANLGLWFSIYCHVGWAQKLPV